MEMNLGIVVVGSLCRSQLGSNQETRPAKIAVGFSRVNEDPVWNNQVSLCDVSSLSLWVNAWNWFIDTVGWIHCICD